MGSKAFHLQEPVIRRVVDIYELQAGGESEGLGGFFFSTLIDAVCLIVSIHGPKHWAISIKRSLPLKTDLVSGL